jgi:hypothetical protein
MAVPPRSYAQLVRHLFNVSRYSAMKLGLQNTESLAALLDHPERKFRTVHVTGTNGKGSVSTKIARGLELSGCRVGLFVSPHISTFRERVSSTPRSHMSVRVCGVCVCVYCACVLVPVHVCVSVDMRASCITQLLCRVV